MYRLLARTPLSKTRYLPFSQMKRKLSPASANMTTTSLQLDPRERQLKNLLVDAADYIDKTGDKALDEKVVLRWAGGWVRDKLLGRPSHDIDVAINCMTGEVFGNRLRDFCAVAENQKRHSLRREDVGRLHKIEKNPDKSKNLETATVKIFGLDVDFVNLRTETYAEDSRNPQMEFGTAEEDARRRDATVNALFYNIHSGEVEDFVGGLEDMHAGLIRTPMEPFQTFMDDPLRVLRLVRFASRLGFIIEPSVKEYMGNEDVLKALRVKISRERVGVEVEKMLKGKFVFLFLGGVSGKPSPSFTINYDIWLTYCHSRRASSRCGSLHRRARAVSHSFHRPGKPRHVPARANWMERRLRVSARTISIPPLQSTRHIGRGTPSLLGPGLRRPFHTRARPGSNRQPEEDAAGGNAGST